MATSTSDPIPAPGGSSHRRGAGCGPSSGRGEQLRRGPSLRPDPTWPDRDRQARLQLRRLANFEAQKLLRDVSTLDRVRKCRHVRAGQAGVEVRQRPDGRVYYGNLQTCGSVWSCPHCADKILAVRAAEVQQAIHRHWSEGGVCALLTLTMRHRPGQTLESLWDALTGAWRAASGGTSGTRLKWRGVEWVKRVEVTVGRNGWHVHVHALLFLDRADLDHTDDLADSTFAAWRASLVKTGLEAPAAGPGVDLKVLSLDGVNSEIAAYLAKGTYTGAESLNERAAGLEIASSAKTARGRNRTPFQVLADLSRFGLSADLDIWREWEYGSFRRRAMTWSKGTRQRLVHDVELTDEEAAREDDGASRVIAVIDPTRWRAIMADCRLAQRVLATVELAGPTRDPHLIVDAILTVAGHSGAVGPPPEPVPQ